MQCDVKTNSVSTILKKIVVTSVNKKVKGKVGMTVCMNKLHLLDLTMIEISMNRYDLYLTIVCECAHYAVALQDHVHVYRFWFLVYLGLT